MGKEHILIVEDEEDILELIRYNLVKEGFSVTGLTSGETVLDTVKAKPPDLILLDLMLPGIDGFEVCRGVKRNPDTRHIPIVIVTAKGEEIDIVTGLELGADDYITKPFSPRVLLARLKTVLRRKQRESVEPDAVLQIAGIQIDPGRHEVRVKGKPISLTFSEFRILHTLALRPGWVFTRDQIVDAVRGEGYAVTDRAVDVQIVGLRKKLKSESECIETVRGIGYRFKEP